MGGGGRCAVTGRGGMARARRGGGSSAAEVVGGDLEAGRAGFCAAAAGRAAREAAPGDFRAMALAVKRAMDARWDPVWHVVAGEAFGCFMTCLEGSYCYLRVPPDPPGGRARDTLFVVFRSQALLPAAPREAEAPRAGADGACTGVLNAPHEEEEARGAPATGASQLHGDLDDLGSKIQTLRRSISIFMRTPPQEVPGRGGAPSPPGRPEPEPDSPSPPRPSLEPAPAP